MKQEKWLGLNGTWVLRIFILPNTGVFGAELVKERRCGLIEGIHQKPIDESHS